MATRTISTNIERVLDTPTLVQEMRRQCIIRHVVGGEPVVRAVGMQHLLWPLVLWSQLVQVITPDAGGYEVRRPAPPLRARHLGRVIVPVYPHVDVRALDELPDRPSRPSLRRVTLVVLCGAGRDRDQRPVADNHPPRRLARARHPAQPLPVLLRGILPGRLPEVLLKASVVVRLAVLPLERHPVHEDKL